MDKKLYARVCDIYAGVTGEQPKNNEQESFLSADELGAFITALFNTFANGDSQYLRYFSLWNLKDFETPSKACEAITNILKWNPELMEKK